MAGGREYSSHQRKIIDRYYKNLDTITAQKLQEIVSELYLAEGKKADRLWKRAEQALAKTDGNRARIDKILTDRDLEGLATLVAGLA